MIVSLAILSYLHPEKTLLRCCSGVFGMQSLQFVFIYS